MPIKPTQTVVCCWLSPDKCGVDTRIAPRRHSGSRSKQMLPLSCLTISSTTSRHTRSRCTSKPWPATSSIQSLALCTIRSRKGGLPSTLSLLDALLLCLWFIIVMVPRAFHTDSKCGHTRRISWQALTASTMPRSRCSAHHWTCCHSIDTWQESVLLQPSFRAFL